MTLTDLGYTSELEIYRKENGFDQFNAGRVIAEHKERYAVKTESGEFEGEILGNLRYSAQSRADFPAVGDWVAVSEYDEGKVLIHAVFPRKTIIERQAVGKQGDKQIIATNINTAFIVQAADRDFNINRIERYLTICNTSGVEPVIIINKTDLISASDLSEMLASLNERVHDVQVFAISNETGDGIEALEQVIEKGKTYCLLGSSGVGKSTLSNILSGNASMKTGEISSATNKGKHVTSHRELIILNNGGLLIDNPGMREVGITDNASGIEATFDTIIDIAQECRFADCTHTSESGCAVIEAVENGDIDNALYENYLKMEREKEHYESSVAERRQKDKNFGKMVKDFKNIKKKGRI